MSRQSYLAPPKASIRVHQPFNPNQGWSSNENKIKRALLALPFLMTFYLAMIIMNASPVVPLIASVLHRGTMVWKSSSVPLRMSFYNFKVLDDL
jgi:D-alanyl-lipoteichoic acid acyltransferase DltB (MBOAT superfamily)